MMIINYIFIVSISIKTLLNKDVLIREEAVEVKPAYYYSVLSKFNFNVFVLTYNVPTKLIILSINIYIFIY